MNIFKKLLIIFSATACLLLPAQALAFNFFGGACQGQAASSTTCQEGQTTGTSPNPVVNVVQKATNLIAVIAGVGAVIIIVIGGINYATAGGSEDKAKSARAMIFNAAIGLAIIGIAWLLVSFIIQKVVS